MDYYIFCKVIDDLFDNHYGDSEFGYTVIWNKSEHRKTCSIRATLDILKDLLYENEVLVNNDSFIFREDLLYWFNFLREKFVDGRLNARKIVAQDLTTSIDVLDDLIDIFRI